MTEVSHTWIDVALTAIAALPGVIAAVSSLRNGRTLKENGHSHTHKTAGKKTSKGGSKDWYEPPNFGSN